MPIADDFDWGAAIRYGLDGPDVTAELNVTSFHDGPYGGGILIGHDAERRLRRVIIVANDLVRRPCEGEIWRVTGPERTDPVYREQIHARVALPLMVSGSAIIRYLATNKRFLGVGWTTAQRLWDEFGPRLYEVIKTHDYRNLATVIGTERAISVVQGFDFLADEIEVFQWLDRYGVSARTAGVAIALWGKEAIEKIRTDPYTLALLEPWRCVDERALKLGLSPTDQRRLVAAVEEAFARHYRSGHTAANERHLIGLVQTLLGFHAASVAPKAIEAAIEAGRVVRHADGLLQGRAAWWMEREVERVFAERMTRRVPAPAQEEIGAVIAAIETADGYQLAHKQKEAIHMAVSSPLSIVCGGAGTGKTTIVKAVLQVLDYPQANSPAAEVRSVRHAQIALAGRAVKRITDMTGRDAMTIARFYHELKAGKTRLKKGLLVIDESSMVDLPTFYKMLTM